MRNLRALLPDGYIQVDYWAPHPCGGYYLAESWCWNSQGRFAYCMEPIP